MSGPAIPEPQKFTLTHWLILIMASIGFAFDIYVLLMLPLVNRAALMEFGLTPGSPDFQSWLGKLFYIPAFVGGVCGLLGGYFTDYFGRRRALLGSIVLYAVSAIPAGYATSPTWLLVFRTLNFVGICIEFVAAVAWLAEAFPNPVQRERVLGYTQLFSSLGGLSVAIANSLAIYWGRRLPGLQVPEFLMPLFGSIKEEGSHAAWRYTMMSGLVLAIPLIFILLFLPESPVWSRKKKEGTLRRPSFREIFSPALRRTTIVSLILVTCAYGAAFGAIQQLPQIVPGLTIEDPNGAGTITTTLGGTAVTGSGTEFTTQLQDGSILEETDGTILGVVSSISSDTALTLTAAGAVSSNAGISYKKSFNVDEMKEKVRTGKGKAVDEMREEIRKKAADHPEKYKFATVEELKKKEEEFKEKYKSATEEELRKYKENYIEEELTKRAVQQITSDYTKVQEFGGMFGRFLVAFLAVYIVSRRWLLRVLQIPGLLLMPLVFYFFLTMPNTKYFEIPIVGVGSLTFTNVSLGMLFAGVVTVGQLSFWGNYLPRVYPVHLRGTGESFAANIGGRLLGTSFAWVASVLAGMDFVPGNSPPQKFAMVAAGVTLFLYLVGTIFCFFLPEPKGELD